MKFGKEFASQMVQEWQAAYMDYNYLKNVLKEILRFRQRNSPSPIAATTPKGSLRRRVSLYRAFSGLTNRYNSFRGGFQEKSKEDEVILVSSLQEGEASEGRVQTMFLMSSDEGGEYELVFFRRLDDEFNKVLEFYKAKVEEVVKEAEELNKQMDALIAFRIRVDNPVIESRHAQAVKPSANTSPSSATSSYPTISGRKSVRSHLEVIQEVEMRAERNVEDEVRPGSESNRSNHTKADKGNGGVAGFRPPSLEVLNHVKINVTPETPVSTLKNILAYTQSDLSFSKEEMRKVEEQMRQAFIEFYQQLRLLKSYCFLNQLAFSKIMKKYDKITSRNASKAYLEMIDKSYISSSDEVTRLIERVESAFIKHFSNGNRKKGINTLRPQAKRERHRVTFFLGLFSGCSIALIVAIIVLLHARHLIRSNGRGLYMRTIFPLYSLFGYIVLHMIMFSGNIYFWRRFRVNYPFIFGLKQGSELGYREVLLLSSGLAVLTLAAVISNLDMEMDPRTRSVETITELVPLGLVTLVLLITFCPFNVVYRTNRFFLIQCVFHCLCAPLYKVTLPDFFLADQLTSQVQAFRCIVFYIGYYGWGDFKTRSHAFQESKVFDGFSLAVAVIPYWLRFVQCLRRLLEDRHSMHAFNGLKYFSTIVAVVTRTGHEQQWGPIWQIMAAASSGVATIVNTYWDIVIDWGLLRRNSKNPWLREKLLVSNKNVYFVAIVLNVILRLAWMQSVLGFHQAPFLPRTAVIAIVACLEIIRRGIWNFFRLENEHLNNVGQYRAFKSVPLPFNYDDEDKRV
ncbi:phosphate transporter PHO1 homolog 3-like [Actinidia eriantha]|uniref:phosphate transporter PHO1 homolog 3-like n=1 Tax=Actinidia eriantha TaxID=165200 RepID=UPI00258C154D|nr:phosphate transporter PHO1 homolog 3-like [Actinidia eriantha]